MGHSKIAKIILFVVLLGHFSGSAQAVDLLEVEAGFSHWVISHNSHGPCVNIGWSHGVEDGNSFDLQASSAEESCQWSNWVGHCDADGFRFSGELLPNPEAWPLGWQQYLGSHISVLLEVTSPTTISASRSVVGIFSGAMHTVTITDPGGLDFILLVEDNDLNSASELLVPGFYRITFSINTTESINPPYAYTGLVEVNWSDTVDTEAESWGSVKSLFRPNF